MPKSRIEFWRDKFEGTIKRDKEHQKQLNKMGWKVHVIWECEIKSIETLKRKVNSIFRNH
jgi:DNA mismatch endonuclease (patch repair protein)